MNRRFGDKQRGVARRKRKPVMFFSLEGRNKTEKYYLISINRDQGEKYSLQFTQGGDTDIQNMWHALQALMQNSFSIEDGDKAFCLCDRDFEEYKLERICEIKQKACQGYARLIVSNPCFEIWFLNHFRYSTRSYGSVKELIDELCNYIPQYEKNVEYYHSCLKSRTREAINNSIRQIEQINAVCRAEINIPGNPGTEAALIIQEIFG